MQASHRYEARSLSVCTAPGHSADDTASRQGSASRAYARIDASVCKAGAMNQDLLKDIDRRVRELFAQSPAADLEKNLRGLLASFFAKLDLVTREEFDVQRQVLLRTREKLAQLEAQVAELERRTGQ